jgi:protein-disulfide isomerase
MIKRLLWTAGFAGLLVLGYVAGRQARRAVAGPSREAAAVEPIGEQREWVDPGQRLRGPADALVTIVMFGDFECASCGRMARGLEELRQAHPREVRLAFYHYPSPTSPTARQTARAAVAAEEQGRFWDFFDKGLVHAHEQKQKDGPTLARQVGLDMTRFNASLSSPVSDRTVEQDRALGSSLGIKGTPTLFVNGRRVLGSRSKQEISGLLDAEMQRARALLRKGVAPDRVYVALVKGTTDSTR